MTDQTTAQSTATPTPQEPPRTYQRHMMRRGEIVREMRRYDHMADMLVLTMPRCWWPWTKARLRREASVARGKADCFRIVLTGARKT